MEQSTSDENGDVKKMTFICKIPLYKLERVPEKKKSDNFSSNNDLQNSDEIDIENIPLSKILRDIEGVNGKISSLREAVIKKNIVRKIKASDVYSTSNSFSATELENKDVNDCNGESPLHGTAIAKKPKHGEFTRKRSKQRKLNLYSELSKLRLSVQSCYNAMQPVKMYTDMRLKYYASISESNCSDEKSSTPKSSKRKYFKDEEAQDSCEYVHNGDWTCEVDGLKMKFRKICEEK